MPSTSKSSTITNPDWLHNSHAGELLLSEFIEPFEMTSESLAHAIGVEPQRIADVIDGTSTIDADLDLRLARYFRMSEGFFLALQLDHELLNARRALNGELDRIVPRAA